MNKPIQKEIRYKLHKWKKQLLITDKILSILVLILIGLFARSDYVVITAFILLIPYIFLTQRESLKNHLLLALIIAFVWMGIARENYGYNREFITFLGFNLYALFAWAIGLFVVYLIYSHYEHFLKSKGYLHKLLLYIAIYWSLLILAETIAFHIFDIKNLYTSIYAPLPICNCIHAPRWMQTSYFLIGPIYFTISYFLKLENPHFRKIN